MTRPADYAVVAGTVICSLLAFAIGQQRQPYVCPVAEGQQVVSTIDSKDAQVCIYANSYGRATRRVKL
jgi:hypothetical protein